MAAKFVGCLLLVVGCVSNLLENTQDFDAQPITIQTLNLFNQMGQLERADPWTGNWVFRRERLALVDAGLREAKPDVAFFQEVMAKGDSRVDSDQEILSVGAMADYNWQAVEIRTHRATHEKESLAIAAGVPYELTEAQPADHIELVDAGFAVAYTIVGRGEPIAAVNLYLHQTGGEGMERVPNVLADFVRRYLARQRVCSDRLIVAGRMPGEMGSGISERLVKELGLKDAAVGFCELAGDCATASSRNDLFRFAFGEKPSERTEKILVPLKAILYGSGRNFTRAESMPPISSPLPLAALWPSTHFGWQVQVRLPRCGSQEGL